MLFIFFERGIHLLPVGFASLLQKTHTGRALDVLVPGLRQQENFSQSRHMFLYNHQHPTTPLPMMAPPLHEQHLLPHQHPQGITLLQSVCAPTRTPTTTLLTTYGSAQARRRVEKRPQCQSPTDRECGRRIEGDKKKSFRNATRPSKMPAKRLLKGHRRCRPTGPRNGPQRVPIKTPRKFSTIADAGPAIADAGGQNADIPRQLHNGTTPHRVMCAPHTLLLYPNP